MVAGDFLAVGTLYQREDVAGLTSNGQKCKRIRHDKSYPRNAINRGKSAVLSMYAREVDRTIVLERRLVNSRIFIYDPM